MKKVLLSLSLLVIMTSFGIISGQAPDWTRVLQVSTASLESVDAVTADASHVYFTAGVSGEFTWGGVNYVANGFRDLLVSKMDISGNVLWSKQFKSEGQSTIRSRFINTDSQGNIYFLAFFTGSVDLGGSFLYAPESGGCFIGKLDPNGNTIWIKDFYPGDLSNTKSRLDIDESGNIYVISNTSKLIKFNQAGEIQFEQDFPARTLQSVLTYGNDVFLAGELQPGFVGFDGLNLQSPSGSRAGFLVKMDPAGNYLQGVVEGHTPMSSKEGNYHAIGTFNHPTAGIRTIDLDRTVFGQSEDVVTTTVADLGTYTLILTINGDNTVTIGGEISPTQPLYASGLNYYDPVSESFTLNYSYDAATGTRIISEVLTKTSSIAVGTSIISDLAFDPAGKIVMMGGFTTDLNLGEMYYPNSAAGNYVFVGKCDNNLAFDWITASNDSKANTGLNPGHRVFVDQFSNISAVGNYYTTGFTFGNAVAPLGGGQFLIRIDPDGFDVNAFRMEYIDATRVFVTSENKVVQSGLVNLSGPNYGSFWITLSDIDITENWAKFSSNNKVGTVSINYVKHDSEGNTYLMTRATGYINYFGNIFNSVNAMTIISKHDINGTLLWMRLIPDINADIFGQTFTLDKDNNVLFVGLFNSVLNIGTTALTTPYENGSEGYVAKYSTNGDFMWAQKMDVGREVMVNLTLTTDTDGNVIVAGVLNPENYLVKFDPAGNRLWSKIMPMESYYLTLVSTDPDNNIYMTSEIHLSNTTGTATIDGVTLNQTYEDGSIGVFKFNPSGTAIWARTYGKVTGGTYSDGWPNDIKTDPDGYTYIWGWCLNNAEFGSYTLNNPIDDGYSYYLMKIDPSGNVKWANAIYENTSNNLYGFNYGALLDLDKAGNIYLGGHIRNTFSIDGSLFQPESTNDFFVAKFNNSGKFQWIKTIPNNTGGQIIQSLSVFSENVLTVAGSPGYSNTLGTFDIIRKGGSTEVVATLGKISKCNAVFTYTWDGFASFTDLSEGSPTAWLWDFGDGTQSTLQNPNHNFPKDGVYMVTLTVFNSGSGCVSSMQKEVIVGSGASCLSAFDFSVNTVTGLTSFTSRSENATDYYWDFDDGEYSTEQNPEHVFINAGIYKVCLTIWNGSTGCQSVSCKNVLFIPPDVKYIDADFSFFTNPTDYKVVFSNLSSSNTTDWYWTMGDGKVMTTENPEHVYAKPGVYNVCLTVFDRENSLSKSICKEVRVGQIQCAIQADFGYFVNPETLEVTFIDRTLGTLTDRYWTFGDGSSSTGEIPRHTYLKPGYYLVSLSVRNNVTKCVDMIAQFIQVGSVECRAAFSFNVDPENNSVKFTDESMGSINYYYWDFGDGTFDIMQNPEKIYKIPGVYVVSQTVLDDLNGCMDIAYKIVQAGEVNCAADFVSYIDSLNFTAYFTNRVLGESTALLWSFGDGKYSTRENPIHQFPGSGIYSVGLNTFDLNSGCMDYYEEMLMIGGLGIDCQADFIFRVDAINSEVKFNNTSVGNITGSVWNFGDASANSNETDPVHSYDNPGYYYVCLGVINSAGIRNMDCKWVLVSLDTEEDCLADFMYTVDSATRQVRFVDNSFGTIDSYAWDFGDSSPDSVSDEANPVHTYDTKGYYLVKLKVENSLKQSKTYKLLNVGEEQVLKAAFGYESREPDKKRSGYPVDLVSASSGDGATVEWDFGDKQQKKDDFTIMDSTSGIITHYYQLPGKYRVCLRVSDPVSGQSDTYCQDVTTRFADNVDEAIPSSVGLSVYPNPFTENTNIMYSLNQPGYIEIALYDQLGRRLETMVREYHNSGTYSIEWERSGYNAGIYHVKLVTDGSVITRQLVIAK